MSSVDKYISRTHFVEISFQIDFHVNQFVGIS